MSLKIPYIHFTLKNEIENMITQGTMETTENFIKLVGKVARFCSNNDIDFLGLIDRGLAVKC